MPLAAPPLLTARQVAAKLGYKSPETVLRWGRRGDGPPTVKLHNGAVRYREDEFEAWVEQQQRATTTRGSATHPASRRPVATLPVATHPHREED